MNADQQINIEALVEANARALCSAWSYFHLLQGMHEGSKNHPVVVQKFDRFFDQVWRAVFDALFAKAGTLIDRTKGTHSLPNLLTLAQRYAKPELKPVLKHIDLCLNAQDGPIAKIESWRHQVVAHRTTEGQNAAFHISNRMKLGEISTGLSQLQSLLNRFSLNFLRVHNDTESGSEDLIEQANALFARIAESPAPNV